MNLDSLTLDHVTVLWAELCLPKIHMMKSQPLVLQKSRIVVREGGLQKGK